jgi:hypothetical protein
VGPAGLPPKSRNSLVQAQQRHVREPDAARRDAAGGPSSRPAGLHAAHLIWEPSWQSVIHESRAAQKCQFGTQLRESR